MALEFAYSGEGPGMENEELLNGAFGGPVWAPSPAATPTVPQDIREAASPTKTIGTSSPRSVMFAWVAVLVVAVLAHVVTFQQQEEGHRHAHFNVMSAIWTYIVLFYIVKPALDVVLVQRFQVPGLSALQKQA